MTRYVVSSRRAGPVDPTQSMRAYRGAVAVLGSVPESPQATSAEPHLSIHDVPSADAEKLKTSESLIIEPLVERRHQPLIVPKAASSTPAVDVVARPAPSSAPPVSMDVTLAGPSGGVAGIDVTLVLTPISVQNQTTGSGGTCQFSYPSSAAPSSLSTGATDGYWTIADTSVATPADLSLPPIDPNGPFGWWHRALGQSSYDAGRGIGIRVGVVDTGLGPNACLAKATAVGSMIGVAFDPTGGADNDGHGTLIAGLIASNPQSDGDFAGVAPAVELFAIRVFPQAGCANQADVAAAIDMLVDEYQVDLINLSLTGSIASTLERDAIQYAYAKGTLCICAAGNDATVVRYPAAYPEAVAVSAIGKQGWGPPGSIASQMVPAAPDQIGEDGLFLAPFSARGTQIACCTPGLGILSTWPAASATQTAWGEDSGTSLAAPLSLGTLATILAACPAYLATPRTEARAHMARQLLTAGCKSIGLSEIYQGSGIPVSA